MRYAKLLAWICAVAVFTATAFASTSALRETWVERSPAAWTIPLPGYVFRTDHVRRTAQPASSPLSPSECTKLGGEVNILFACKSGRVCSRENQDGRSHGVCLSQF